MRGGAVQGVTPPARNVQACEKSKLAYWIVLSEGEIFRQQLGILAGLLRFLGHRSPDQLLVLRRRERAIAGFFGQCLELILQPRRIEPALADDALGNRHAELGERIYPRGLYRCFGPIMLQPAGRGGAGDACPRPPDRSSAACRFSAMLRDDIGVELRSNDRAQFPLDAIDRRRSAACAGAASTSSAAVARIRMMVTPAPGLRASPSRRSHARSGR